VPLIVQARDIGQVNPGDRQRAATVQGLAGRKHQVADRGEQDRGIQWHRRRIGGALRRRGTKPHCQLLCRSAASHHVHFSAL